MAASLDRALQMLAGLQAKKPAPEFAPLPATFLPALEKASAPTAGPSSMPLAGSAGLDRALEGGGNSEASVGPSLGFGKNGADTTAGVAAQFGQFAGKSPLSAALSTPNLNTPAGLLSGIFSAIPSPDPFSGIIGPIARAMQQSAINDAMKIELENTAMRESMAPRGVDVTGPGGDTGAPPGPPGVSAATAAAAQGLVDAITAEATIGVAPNTSDMSLSVTGIDGTGGDGTGPSGGPGAGGPAGPGAGVGVGGDGNWHTGGTIRKTGRANLQRGEEVVRASEAKKVRPALKNINRPGVSPLERRVRDFESRHADDEV